MAKPTEPDELEVRRRLREMKDDELLDFIRETAVRLHTAADRLEIFADSIKPADGGDSA